MHSGNWGHYEKAKPMHNKDKEKRGKPGQRHRKYFLENCRRKFSQSKERNVYQSKKLRKKHIGHQRNRIRKEIPHVTY